MKVKYYFLCLLVFITTATASTIRKRAKPAQENNLKTFKSICVGYENEEDCIKCIDQAKKELKNRNKIAIAIIEKCSEQIPEPYRECKPDKSADACLKEVYQKEADDDYHDNYPGDEHEHDHKHDTENDYHDDYDGESGLKSKRCKRDENNRGKDRPKHPKKKHDKPPFKRKDYEYDIDYSNYESDDYDFDKKNDKKEKGWMKEGKSRGKGKGWSEHSVEHEDHIHSKESRDRGRFGNKGKVLKNKKGKGGSCDHGHGDDYYIEYDNYEDDSGKSKNKGRRNKDGRRGTKRPSHNTGKGNWNRVTNRPQKSRTHRWNQRTNRPQKSRTRHWNRVTNRPKNTVTGNSKQTTTVSYNIGTSSWKTSVPDTDSTFTHPHSSGTDNWRQDTKNPNDSVTGDWEHSSQRPYTGATEYWKHSSQNPHTSTTNDYGTTKQPVDYSGPNDFRSSTHNLQSTKRPNYSGTDDFRHSTSDLDNSGVDDEPKSTKLPDISETNGRYYSTSRSYNSETDAWEDVTTPHDYIGGYDTTVVYTKETNKELEDEKPNGEGSEHNVHYDN